MLTSFIRIIIGSFFLFQVSLLNAQSDERKSYLQNVTPNSVVVKLKTAFNTQIQVCYYRDPTGQSVCVNSLENTTDHEVTLEGLLPGTKYYYDIKYFPSLTVLQGFSFNQYFRAAPEVGTREPVRAWILGDVGDGIRDNRDDVRVVRDKYLEYSDTNGKADLILLLGDNAYGYENEDFEDGEDDTYQVKFFDIFEDILQNTPSFSCIGNHDADPLSGQSGPYFDIFAHPEDSGNESYYSFDFGNIHFIVLDSERTDRRVGEPMFDWAQDDLADTTQEWIVAIWHHPPYSKNTSHDSDTEGRLVEMRENFLPMLEDYGVDLVLSGHSHSYSRSKYVTGHYTRWDDFRQDQHVVGDNGELFGQTGEDFDGERGGAYQKDLENDNGTLYVVTGSSSKLTPLINPDSSEWKVMRYRAEALGSTLMEVEGNRMDIKFLNSAGEIQDHCTIYKGAPEINIITPNEFTHFESDDDMEIKWADNSDENLAVRLQSINDVSLNVDLFPAVTIPSSESQFNWTIPSSIEPGLYRIRVGGNTNHAVNSEWFPIDTFYVNALSPNFGDNFQVGDILNVDYTTNITEDDISNANKLRMRFLIGEGLGESDSTSILVVSETVDPDSRTIPFEIPAEAQNEFCRIKFMYTVSGEERATSFSEPFRVGDPVPNDISFTSPAPNSSFNFGDIVNIIWQDQIPYDLKMNLYQQTEMGGVYLKTLPDVSAEISSVNFNINDHISEPGLYKVKLAWNIGGQTQSSAISEIFSVGAVASNLRSINNSEPSYVIEQTPEGDATHLKGDFSNSQVYVVNTAGQTVKTYNNQDSSIFIDHEQLPMGKHILRIESLTNPDLSVQTILKSY